MFISLFLGLLLYFLCTRDLPSANQQVAASFAGATVIHVADDTIEIATNKLQETVYLIAIWAKKWRIELNESKSAIEYFIKKKVLTSQSLTMRR